MKDHLSQFTESITPNNLASVGQTAMAAMFILMILLPTFAGLAVAAEDASDTTTEFICQKGDDGKYPKFVQTMSALLTILIVAGPLIGTVMAAFAQVAASGSKDKADEWMKTRKKALISGWSVPVLIYMAEILGNALLGIDLSCIIP